MNIHTPFCHSPEITKRFYKFEIRLFDITNYAMYGERDLDADFMVAGKTKRSFIDLERFLIDKRYETPRGSPYTNVIDQKGGRTFYFPFSLKTIEQHSDTKIKSGRREDSLGNNTFVGYDDPSTYMNSRSLFTDPDPGNLSPMEQFLMKTEACRADGIPLCFSERQYFTIPHTGKTVLASTDIPDSYIKNLKTSKSTDFDVDSPHISDPIDDFDDNQDTVQTTSELVFTEDDTPSHQPDTTNVLGDKKPAPTHDDLVEKGSTTNYLSKNTALDIHLDKSCIEFDFDIYMKADVAIQSDIFFQILNHFTIVAVDVLDLSANGSENPLENRTYRVHILCGCVAKTTATYHRSKRSYLR